MSKLSPTEARNFLVAAGFIKPDANVPQYISRHKNDPNASRESAIEQRKRMFKQAEQKKGGE
jgi:hypothetical protein